MATELLNCSAVSSKGSWTGTDADIFDAVGDANNNGLNNATTEGDVLLLDLDDSALADGDTITNVSVVVRGQAPTNSSDGMTAQIYIGGAAQGVAVAVLFSGGDWPSTWGNSDSINDVGWNSDWTASELDGMQLRLVTTQAGMPGNVDLDLDAVDVTITYTPAAGDKTVLPGAGALTLTGYAPVMVDSSPNTGVLFDDTNDYLGGVDPASLTDNDLMGISFWYKPTSGASVDDFVYYINGARVVVRISAGDASNRIVTVSTENASAVKFWEMDSTASLVIGEWNHVIIRRNSTATEIYINDVDEKDADTTGPATDDTDWNGGGDSWIGTISTLTPRLGAAIQEVWIANQDPGALATESNRRKFLNANGTPANLGADGSTPTGTQPAIYLRNAYTSFETNLGSLGDFTVTGALADDGTLPSITLGGDKTVAPGKADLVLAGFAPTLVQTDDKFALPAQADLVLTGFAPTLDLSVDITIPVAAGALALEGFAPTLAETDNKVAQPNKADLALTGFAPTLDLTLDLVVQPAAAALALTGFIPVVDVAANQIVQPAQADLALTGFAPTLDRTDNKTVAPANADLALTGFAPTLDLTLDLIVQPGAGALVLTGFVPVADVAADKIVQPGQADLTLTGFAPVLAQTDDKIVQPAQADLSLEGFAPIVAIPADIIVLPSQADLVLEGFAPTVQRTDDHLIAVPKADLALGGFAPAIDLTDDKTVSPANAALVLEGFIPSIVTDGSIVVDVPAAALALEGFEPTINRTDDHIVQPASAAMTITGNVPVVVLTNDKTASPNAAALTITGQAPVLVLTADHAIQVPNADLALEGFAPVVTGGGAPVDIAVPAGALALAGFAPSIDIGLLFAPNLGRTAFVARSHRTAKVFSENRTAKVARDPGDAVVKEQ